MKLGGRATSPLRRRRSRLARALVVILRVLALVGAFELSGAGAALAEIAATDDGTRVGCCSDCPSDEGPCTPGCPSCHCAHGTTALPPAFEVATSESAFREVRAAVAPYEAEAPRPPPSPGLYRPPRSVPTFA